ncbi:MAG: oligosaccharide flippase family protein [Terriglobia bacterium]
MQACAFLLRTLNLGPHPTGVGLSATAMWERLRPFLSVGSNATKAVFVRRVSGTYAVRLVILGIAFATSALVARELGPAGRGLYGVAVVLMTLGSQFGNMGLVGSNTYYVASYSQLLPRLISNSLLVAGVAGGFVSLLLFVVIAIRPAWAPLPGGILSTTLLWIPLALGYLLLQNLLIGVQQVKTYNVVEIASRLSFLALVTLLVLARDVSALHVVIAGLAASGFSLALALWRLLPISGALPKPDWALLRRQGGYGLRSYLGGVFAYMVLKIDVLMVKYMAGATQAGYYSLSSSLTDFVNTFPPIVGLILFPTLTGTVSVLQRWKRAKMAAIGVAGLMCLIAGAAIIVARPFIILAFGRAYLPSVPSFRILSVAIVFYAANNMISIYLASSGFPWFGVWVWLGAAALNIGLNLVAIPRYGITGAAVSSLVTYSVILLVQALYAGGFTRRLASTA